MFEFLWSGIKDSMEYLKEPATAKQAAVSILTYVGALVLASIAHHSRRKLKAMAARREEARNPKEEVEVQKPFGMLASAIWEAVGNRALSLLRTTTKAKDGTPREHLTGLEIPGRNFRVVLAAADGSNLSTLGRPLFYLSGSEVGDELTQHEFDTLTKYATARWETLKNIDRMRKHKEWARTLLASDPEDANQCVEEVNLCGDCVPRAEPFCGTTPVVSGYLDSIDRRR